MTTNLTGNRHGTATIDLPSDTDLLITRVFDAPAELLYKATTTPELVKRWYGFESSEWVVCEIDLRVGGAWRYVTRDEGVDVGFHGEYFELEAPHRIVSTEVFEGVPGMEIPDDAFSTNTVTFTEVDGVTTMTVLCSFSKPEYRDGLLASGMEGGMNVSYDRLEDLVRSQG